MFEPFLSIEGSYGVSSGQLSVLSNVENFITETFHCTKRFAVNFQGVLLLILCQLSATVNIKQVLCQMFKKSLASMESESIIPEWFFETTIVIEPERIEFKNGKNSRSVVTFK